MRSSSSQPTLNRAVQNWRCWCSITIGQRICPLTSTRRLKRWRSPLTTWSQSSELAPFRRRSDADVRGLHGYELTVATPVDLAPDTAERNGYQKGRLLERLIGQLFGCIPG